MAGTTQEDIIRIIAGYDRASDAPGYADTIVCQMEQESGDNYKMIWSTEYSGGFKPNRTE